MLASVATIQESLRRSTAEAQSFSAAQASVATIQESLRRSTTYGDNTLLLGISRHDSGELEAGAHQLGHAHALRASVATIQESLRRLQAQPAAILQFRISRHDSGELEAAANAAEMNPPMSHQSPRFRRA